MSKEHKDGTCGQKIAEMLNRLICTIGAMIWSWKTFGMMFNLPRIGRPHKLLHCYVGHVALFSEKSPFAASGELLQELEQRGENIQSVGLWIEKV